MGVGFCAIFFCGYFLLYLSYQFVHQNTINHKSPLQTHIYFLDATFCTAKCVPLYRDMSRADLEGEPENMKLENSNSALNSSY